MTYFSKSEHTVTINGKVLPLKKFKELEPDYSCNYLIEYFDSSGHWVSNGPDSETVDASSLLPSRQVYIDRAIAGAYDSPDWSGFRLALMGSASFNAWAEALSPTLRENLKIAAVVENLQAVQEVYNLAIAAVEPDEEFRDSWQGIADSHRIKLNLAG